MPLLAPVMRMFLGSCKALPMRLVAGSAQVYIPPLSGRNTKSGETVTLSSMTGYARVDGRSDNLRWTWEIKSVNGKGLDVRCRLASGFERLEAAARRQTGVVLRRGNVNISLAVVREAAAQRPIVNRALLDDVLALQMELAGKVADTPPRIETLLQVRGLIDLAAEEEDEKAAAVVEAAMLESLDEALVAVAATRQAEGEQLHAALSDQLQEIEALVVTATSLAATQPDAILARLKAQVADLLDAAVPQMPEDRLMHEVALLAAKADIREELDRLRAHIAAAHDLLAEAPPIGRRLDFLCQEFNREANTLCAKSNDIDLTSTGLALKAVIDQMKEQVQNIE